MVIANQSVKAGKQTGKANWKTTLGPTDTLLIHKILVRTPCASHVWEINTKHTNTCSVAPGGAISFCSAPPWYLGVIDFVWLYKHQCPSEGADSKPQECPYHFAPPHFGTRLSVVLLNYTSTMAPHREPQNQWFCYVMQALWPLIRGRFCVFLYVLIFVCFWLCYLRFAHLCL